MSCRDCGEEAGGSTLLLFRRDRASKSGHEAGFYLLASHPAVPRARCVGSRAQLLPKPMKAFSLSENKLLEEKFQKHFELCCIKCGSLLGRVSSGISTEPGLQEGERGAVGSKDHAASEPVLLEWEPEPLETAAPRPGPRPLRIPPPRSLPCSHTAPCGPCPCPGLRSCSPPA